MTNPKFHTKKGAITAMDITFDSKVICIGYQNGHIDLYEIEADYLI